MYKGIFWRALSRDGETVWVCKKVLCDSDGVPTEAFVGFSSKSGDNFNHKAEWEKLGKSITGGQPFDWFPRGRVEIKRGEAVIYAHPALTGEDCICRIKEEFRLDEIPMRVIADGSAHYRALIFDAALRSD